MYTLEHCEQLWIEAGQHGTPAERIERARAWLPYYSFFAEPQKEADFSLSEDDGFFPSYLIREGLVKPTDRVLEIGTGLGIDSLRFASCCASVTALEMNSDCIEVLRHRAERCGFENIRPVQGAWETFQPEERFDVSYSAMCPAICDMEELQRLESITKRLCCLVTVMRGSCEKHRRAMIAELGIRPRGGMLTELIHYFNVLYLMGRQPSVYAHTVEHCCDMTAETVLKRFPIYFKVFGVDEDRSVPFLEDYLARHAENGVLREESRIHYGLITWNVG